MKIFGLVQDSIVDGPGFRFACFVQGCPHHCPGCHNPDSHDPDGGREMAVEEGLIDSLGGLNEAIEKLYQLIESQPDKEEPEDPPAKGAKKAQAPGPKKKPAPAAPGKKSPGRPRKKREAAAALPVMPPLPPTSQAGAEPPPKRRPGRPRKEER